MCSLQMAALDLDAARGIARFAATSAGDSLTSGDDASGRDA